MHLHTLGANQKIDGSDAANAVILDTSSTKYTVVNSNSLDITFSNVTKEDGGLYHCVYGGIGATPELCVYVYGKLITDMTHEVQMELFVYYQKRYVAALVFPSMEL